MFITIVIAIWELTAIADYFCHRRTEIEKTGVSESAIHMLLIAQVAIVFNVAIFAPTVPWIAVFIVGNIITHAAISIIDLMVASKHRYISNFEHALHYGLNICPAIVGAVYIAEYPAPSITYITWLFAFISLGVIVPYFEELIRCLRYR